MLKRHLQQSTLCILVPTYAPLYFLKNWFAPPPPPPPPEFFSKNPPDRQDLFCFLFLPTHLWQPLAPLIIPVGH